MSDPVSATKSHRGASRPTAGAAPPGSSTSRVYAALSHIPRLYGEGAEWLGWRLAAQKLRGASLLLRPDDVNGLLRQAASLRRTGQRDAASDRLDAVRAAIEAQEHAYGLTLEGDDTTPRYSPTAPHTGPKVGHVARQWIRLAKELAQFSRRGEARACFEHALRLGPDRQNLWRQFGEFLLRNDDRDGASYAFSQAYAASGYEPGFREALAVVERLNGFEIKAGEMASHQAPWSYVAAAARRGAMPTTRPKTSPKPSSETPSRRVSALVVDLSDLLIFLEHRGFVSGIQRVQAELALRLLRPKAGEKAGFAAVYDTHHGQWRLIEPNGVLALIDDARGRSIKSLKEMRQRVGAVRRSSGGRFDALVRPVLFVPGATWSDWRYLLSVREAKRRQGLRYVPFVHDCIPLLFPETCAAEVPDNYRRWLAGASQTADAFVVNSQQTGADLSQFLEPLLPGGALPPITVLPLNARSGEAIQPKPPTLPKTMSEALSTRGFAVVVGSVEPRKNHIDLFKTWERLVRERGPDVPLLLVVGRPGWREDAVAAYLDASELLRGHVLWLPDTSDEELRWLYESARFSLCASAYEGWGMPVTEALEFGVPTIVADNSALRESGAAALRYPTSDLDTLFAHVAALSDEGDAYAVARASAAAADLREWGDLADDVRVALEAVAKAPERAGAPSLVVGEDVSFGSRALDRGLVAQEAATLGAAWGGRDSEGYWILGGGYAELCFRIPPLEAEATLTIGYRRADPGIDAQIVYAVDGEPQSRAPLDFAPDGTGHLSVPVPGSGGEQLVSLILETTAAPLSRALGIETVCLDAA
ncbi:MAG: glycosyltransferase [Pseudomonadota bacterium]